MWSGILCDLCKIRVPAFRMEADLEIPEHPNDKSQVTSHVLTCELDVCEPCATRKDPRVIHIHSLRAYKEDGSLSDREDRGSL